MLDARPKLNPRREHSVLKWPTGKWPLYVLFLAAAGLLVAGGFAIRGSRPVVVPVRTQIIHAGQSIVQSSLAEGIHAAFGGEEETVVEPMSDGKTMVSGWVDLLNDAGQHDRQNYSVVVYKDPTNGWMGERITVIPQM